jgi:hypothetical protein
MSLSIADMTAFFNVVFNPYPYENTSLETMWVFIREGVIEQTDPDKHGKQYQVTRKGKKWLEMILSTPYPVFRWVDPREDE